MMDSTIKDISVPLFILSLPPLSVYYCSLETTFTFYCICGQIFRIITIIARAYTRGNKKVTNTLNEMKSSGRKY